jgi:hexokinase
MIGELNPGEISSAKKKVEEFLSNYGMNYSEIDIQKHVDLFVQEMQEGLSGKKSSLRMFPTYIGFKRVIPSNEPVIVLDAGGTNLRSALLHFDNKNKPVITNFSKTDMPGIEREASKAEFFRAIAENVKVILGNSQRIGFVFSYPIEIYPDRDGRLVRFTKEIKASEVEGEFIGKNLIDVIKRYEKSSSSKHFVILNDTVATLLSGISAFSERNYGSYIGFVFGTGMNACYIEKNSNIQKAKGKGLDPDDYQLINIEAGNFSRGPRGKIDEAFDKKTLNPGIYNFEKMFSGAYFGGLALEVLKYSAYSGIFSDRLSLEIKKLSGLESRDVSDFLYYPPANEPMLRLNENMSESDRIKAYYLLDSLEERAAILTTIVLVASILKSGSGRNPLRPVCIVAEGSSYYKMKNFQSKVCGYMGKVLSERGNYYFEINRVENAVMLGAAVAALTCQ